jgi:citrate lyase subunit beta-like protein
VPKVNSAADLHFVTDVIRHTLPSHYARYRGDTEVTGSPIKILALIESAKAITDLSSICKASPYLSGLIFAAEDFALDMSLIRTPSLTEFLFARSAVATAARAHNLASTIDLVCTSYKGGEGQKALERECIGGKSLGFNGKQCIHPSQVETVQRTFAPSEEEVEWAVRLLVADEKAVEQGRGAWTMDGKMIDAPVVGKAKSVMQKAEACGINTTELREKWKDEQPQ